MHFTLKLMYIVYIVILVACSSTEDDNIDYAALYPDFYSQFGDTLDLADLPNYANQTSPDYIDKDNTQSNPITDEGALLGRILFYDTNLSSDNTIACASCHQQEHAFSDLDAVGTGVNGATGRHSMRLINSRFADEAHFFWDERADTLEEQSTMPIQDHNEMGFSGSNGDPSMQDLISKLEGIGYYTDLFDFVFDSAEITEEKIQLALAQFVRSIQSFDSKYDTGRALVNADNQDFSNFSSDENAGKTLFLRPPNQGGAGCAVCHRPPEFDIRPNSLNNGVIGVFGSLDTDLTVTRSPSLRDLVKADGSNNGAFMHDASLSTLEEVIDHYDAVADNANIDDRLSPAGSGRNLGLNASEKAQLVAFLKTLSGSNVYTDEKWSPPF